MLTRDDLLGLSTIEIIRALDKNEAESADAEWAISQQTMPVPPDMEFVTKITRLAPDQEPNSPRKMYIHGTGVDAPTQPQREGESTESFLKRQASIHGHLSSLLWLVTSGLAPFLRSVIANLGEPEVVQLKSQFDPDTTYNRTVAPWGPPSDNVYLQLSTKPSKDEALFLKELAQKMLTVVTNNPINGPTLNNTVMVNGITEEVTQVAVPTALPVTDKYEGHLTTEGLPFTTAEEENPNLTPNFTPMGGEPTLNPDIF